MSKIWKIKQSARFSSNVFGYLVFICVWWQVSGPTLVLSEECFPKILPSCNWPGLNWFNATDSPNWLISWDWCKGCIHDLPDAQRRFHCMLSKSGTGLWVLLFGSLRYPLQLITILAHMILYKISVDKASLHGFYSLEMKLLIHSTSFGIAAIQNTWLSVWELKCLMPHLGF